MLESRQHPEKREARSAHGLALAFYPAAPAASYGAWKWVQAEAVLDSNLALFLVLRQGLISQADLLGG